MDRNFLKQSIRRELDYYKDGLFNEDEDEYWERAWAAPDDDDSMAENGFLNVAMAHLQGDECDEIVLLGTEYGLSLIHILSARRVRFCTAISLSTSVCTVPAPFKSCSACSVLMTGIGHASPSAFTCTIIKFLLLGMFCG